MTDKLRVRSAELGLNPRTFELIAGDRPDLTRNGRPHLSRIADLAGVSRQRMSDVATALQNNEMVSATMLGPLVGAYVAVHDVDDRTALTAILRLERAA